ncbi:terminase [Pseudaeromonas paramecii]|uniref:Terminase n=1 Tax=Pseudaeromonas paramecii TaxID=2138166 RepID=A0ABP8PUW8_9GAMM
MTETTNLTAMTEQEQREYIRARLSDKWWRMNNLYQIENEQGQLVRFRLRPAQELLFRCMWFLNIILKARQLGFSTAIDIYLLDEALFNKNIKCGIIAQDRSAAGEIYRTKIEVPFDNLPAWLRAEFPTAARRGGANGGYILFRHGSSIQVATSFRSGTVQRLHVSEHGKICAKYPEKAKEVRTGTLNAIHPGCVAFIESTAEGVGGDFHGMSMKAMELAKAQTELSKMDWKFHFFAWWQDPKYHADVPMSGLTASKTQLEYFAAVEKAMGCTITDEQRQWYVNKEAEQGAEMKQEFPSTPLEAFLTSGRRVFDPIHTMAAEGDCLPPLLVYDMDPVTGSREKARKPEKLDEQGIRSLENMLLVWELPDEDEDYAVGVDVAEGLEHGDRASIDVVARSDGRQVAHWYGHLDPGLLAQLVAHIGKWYGTDEYGPAFVGPERNNHGHALLLKLRDHYPVSRIYAEEYLDRDDDDETPRLGWLTTRQSKPVLVDGLKTLLRGGVSGIRWIGTISEATTYVYDKSGSMNAQVGCYDDQLMSYMIAQEMRARMPARPVKSDLKRTPKHWMAH